MRNKINKDTIENKFNRVKNKKNLFLSLNKIIEEKNKEIMNYLLKELGGEK